MKVKSWPDGGIGRFYFCQEHGVLARRQTRKIDPRRRSCKYCLNRKTREWYRENPEKRREIVHRAAARHPEKYAESNARFRAEQAAWTERYYGGITQPLEERSCYSGSAGIRTPRTFEVLNDQLPTWPQWVNLLGAVMAPITPTDLERWSHDAELKREAKIDRVRRKWATWIQQNVDLAHEIMELELSERG